MCLAWHRRYRVTARHSRATRTAYPSRGPTAAVAYGLRPRVHARMGRRTRRRLRWMEKVDARGLPDDDLASVLGGALARGDGVAHSARASCRHSAGRSGLGRARVARAGCALRSGGSPLTSRLCRQPVAHSDRPVTGGLVCGVDLDAPGGASPIQPAARSGSPVSGGRPSVRRPTCSPATSAQRDRSRACGRRVSTGRGFDAFAVFEVVVSRLGGGRLALEVVAYPTAWLAPSFATVSTTRPLRPVLPIPSVVPWDVPRCPNDRQGTLYAPRC
jgi:hypothetical protein